MKEDRRQNIMTSVALKKGVEEPWTIERVAKFIGRWVEHAGCILSRCQKGRDGKTPFERLHGKKPTEEFVPFGEKKCWQSRSQQNQRTE